MLRSVDKLNLSLFSWNCKITDLICHQVVDKVQVKVNISKDFFSLSHSLIIANNQNKSYVLNYMITICILQKFLLLHSNNRQKRNYRLTFFSDTSSGWLGMSSFFTLENLDQKMRNITSEYCCLVSAKGTKPLLKYKKK